MSQQQCFAFVAEEKTGMTVGKRPTEKEINEKLRYMQSLPDAIRTRTCLQTKSCNGFLLADSAWKSRDRQDR